MTVSLCSSCRQAKRISGSDALSHPYLDEGRLRYHTCMCQCCYSVPSGRVYTRDFEPVAERPFSHSYENSLLSVWQGKGGRVSILYVVFWVVFVSQQQVSVVVESVQEAGLSPPLPFHNKGPENKVFPL